MKNEKQAVDETPVLFPEDGWGDERDGCWKGIEAAQDNANRFQSLWVSPNLRHSDALGG